MYPTATPLSTTALQDAPIAIHDVSEANLAAAIEETRAIINDSSAFLTDSKELDRHSNTPWSPASTDQQPHIVIKPSSTDHISAIMRVCSRRRIPVVGYSGGTSLQGALASTRGGFCLDFQRMAQIIAIHEDDMDVVVQPGIMCSQLNKQLEPTGFFFPPDPSPEAHIGGMIAMNCSGTNAYRYGTMKDWVIGLTVVLADGTIVRTRRRPRKSSAGYDLTRLIVGSEGTLALVTEAVLKLAPLPVNMHVAITTFPDVHAATRTGLALIRAGLLLEALELLDHTSMKAINISKLSTTHWDEDTTLFLKFAGSHGTVTEHIATAKAAAAENGCKAFEVSNNPDIISTWWGARKSVAKALLSLKAMPSDIFMSSDAAVPISRLSDIMAASQKILADSGMPGSVVGHLGDGNTHVGLLCPDHERSRGEAIISEIERLAVNMDGTITGEHGIGLKLRDLLIEEVGSNTVDMMRQIKLALDPLCILNCDKVVRMPEKTKI